MTTTSGSQLATLIQSVVEALAARGFDPREAPFDLPADAPARVAERVAEFGEFAGDAGLKALSMLTSAATVGLERLAAMDADAFDNSKLGKALDEVLRKAAERQARWF